MGDIALQWETDGADLAILADDLASDAGLRTAVILSLFLDRRAEDDDPLPAEDGDRRGWWADQFAQVEGDRIGSRLWLLDRSKRTEDRPRRAEEIDREALAWLIADHVTERIDVHVIARGEALEHTIDIYRPQRDPLTFRFETVWGVEYEAASVLSLTGGEPEPEGPAFGHLLDADTLALWRMNEASAGNLLQADDASGGARHLAAASYAVAAKPTNGPVVGRLARLFNGDTAANDILTRAGDAPSLAVFQGQYTLQCFLRIDDLAVGNVILSYAAAGETAAANFQVRWAVLASTGLQQIFWESGSGTDHITAQTVGSPVVAGTWYHLAVVKNATHLRFFLNGVMGEAVALPTLPTGGTTAAWVIGADQGGTLELKGAICDLKVSNVALSDVAVAAEAALLGTTGTLPLDASTFALWRMAEAPAAIDESVNGRHLSAPVPASVTHGAAPLVADGGHAKLFVTSGELDTAPSTESADLAAVFAGPFTFEAWFQLGEIAWAARRGLFCYGNPGVETQVDNYVSLDITATRALSFDCEHGSGVNAAYTTTYALPATEVGERHHVALRKNAAAAGLFTVDFFVDGVLVESSGSLLQYDGGANGVFRLGTGNTEVDWYGLLDDVRLSGVARTNAEILESYQRGGT